MLQPSDRRTFTTRAGVRLDFTCVGFGGTGIGNMHAPITEEAAMAIVDAAWGLGVRYFDTAPLYGLGLSEMRTGRGLAARPRRDFIVSTKVGRRLVPAEPGESNGGIYKDTPPVKFVYDYSYDGVMRSFDESIGRLGLDSVDILFVHDADGRAHGGRAGSEARLQELMERGGWRALDNLRSGGAVKAIGAGVNEWEPCARLLELADPDLFLLAGRYTLLEQEPLNALFPLCEKRGVGVIIGGALNSGALAGHPYYDYAPITAPIQRRIDALADLCAAHGVPLVDAALQFAAAPSVVASIVVGATSADEARANAASFSTPIPAALWNALKQQRAIHLEAPTPC